MRSCVAIGASSATVSERAVMCCRERTDYGDANGQCQSIAPQRRTEERADDCRESGLDPAGLAYSDETTTVIVKCPSTRRPPPLRAATH